MMIEQIGSLPGIKEKLAFEISFGAGGIFRQRLAAARKLAWKISCILLLLSFQNRTYYSFKIRQTGADTEFTKGETTYKK